MGTAPLLRDDRDFRWYWLSQSLSMGGSQVTAFALPLVAVVSLNSGAAGVSAVAAASFLPNLFLPLIAGHVLEKRRKRHVMIWADALRAVLLLMVPLAWVNGGLTLSLLVGVAFGVGAISVFFDISGFAFIPSLVSEDRLPQANQAVQGSATMAEVAGPGVSGLVVQVLGAPLALLIDSLSYLVSAFGLSRVRTIEETVDANGKGRVRDGVVLLLSNRYLRALTIHAAVYNAAAQILTINLLIWALEDRGLSTGAFGLALSCAGAGALLGTVIALRAIARLGFGRSFVAALSLSTGTPLLTALIPGSGLEFAVVLGAIQLVSGAGLGCANVLSTTLRQIVVPMNQVARTNGGYRFLMYGSIPLGSAAGGLLGSVYSSRVGVAVGTIGLAMSALPMLTRHIRALADPHDAASATAATPTAARHGAADQRRTT